MPAPLMLRHCLIFMPPCRCLLMPMPPMLPFAVAFFSVDVYYYYFDIVAFIISPMPLYSMRYYSPSRHA